LVWAGGRRAHAPRTFLARKKVKRVKSTRFDEAQVTIAPAMPENGGYSLPMAVV
jgi:hypothetical protein